MSGSAPTLAFVVVRPFQVGAVSYSAGDLVLVGTLTSDQVGQFRQSLAGPITISAGTAPPSSTGTTTTATGTATGTGAGLTTAQLAALATAETQAAAALPSTGGTATGLTLAADPTTALGAATKQYVDTHAGSGSGGGAAFTVTTLTASGTTQATAAPLPDTVNTIISAAAGSGVILPAVASQPVVVENQSAVAVLVYPPVGAQVNATGTNLPVEVLPGGSATFTPASSTQFYSE